MKKILFIVAAIALLAGVSSCKKEKEGKYAPKEKIQSVYQEYAVYYGGEVVEQEAKYLSEEWTWEKDLLNRITYYSQDTYPTGEGDETVTEREVIYTQLFTYDDDDSLVKSEILGYANMKAVCEYEGNYLKTMTIWDGDEVLAIYQFNHDGKKITSFDLTLGDMFEDVDKKAMQQMERVNPLRFLLNTEVAAKTMAATKECAKRAAKAGRKDDVLALHFALMWDGDNVKSIGATYMGETLQYDFKYDNKNNPFYNLFEIVGTVENSFMPFMPLSKNNVTSIVQTESAEGESYTETFEYTYTYNSKDFPTSKSVDETEDEYRVVQTYYYEYK